MKKVLFLSPCLIIFLFLLTVDLGSFQFSLNNLAKYLDYPTLLAVLIPTILSSVIFKNQFHTNITILLSSTISSLIIAVSVIDRYYTGTLSNLSAPLIHLSVLPFLYGAVIAFVTNTISFRLIGIGSGSSRPLPQHRTYGSVYGA